MLYVINFSRFSLLWVSKLQTEVDLSKFHSGDVALPRSFRGLLPLKNLIKEVIITSNLDVSKFKFASNSTVHEDNWGDIPIAAIPSMIPTSKHLAVKYYCF